jgi:hypothetical protein
MAQIGHADAAQAPAPDLGLLEVALRTRAGNAEALAGLALLDPDATRLRLQTLQEHGYLRLDGDRISYREPDAVLAERAADLLDKAQLGLHDRVLEAQSLLAAIPRLMESWGVGGSQQLDLKVEMFHGPFASTELWLELAQRQPPPLTCGSLPDAARLFGADPALRRRWLDVVEREGLRIRGLLSSADVSGPEAEAVIAEDRAIGMEFRMLAQPPGWFWCTDEVAALPLRWGEAWPTSTIAIRSESVATLVRWVFDRLWAAALPVPFAEHGWEGLLQLMSQGATLEAASRALGVSSRTGRRRIESAMDHYGVSGQLALGAAWAREHGVLGS